MLYVAANFWLGGGYLISKRLYHFDSELAVVIYPTYIKTLHSLYGGVSKRRIKVPL